LAVGPHPLLRQLQTGAVLSPIPFTTMQMDLVVAGFRSVVMFDGGYAFGYEDGRRMLFGRFLDGSRSASPIGSSPNYAAGAMSP
jgi:hypothetical protein